MEPAWLCEPFLHLGDGKAYNPLTDQTLSRGEAGWDALERALQGRETNFEERARLMAEGWLVKDEPGLERRYRLKYVALETHTVCNQSCYFCPVAYAPRDAYFMQTRLYERLVDELTDYRETLEGVFLMNYNEPTVDKRFVEQCKSLLRANLAAGVNSNGSGLTPQKVDALVEAGPLRYLSINLSTMDREKYRRDRGKDQLPKILENLDYVKDRPIAEEMVIAVLGTGDAQHRLDYERIQQRYGTSRFQVNYAEIMDRAGHLEVGHKPDSENPVLRGCENIGSRPLQHLHINPYGKCVFCCEDYDEQHIVGDLTGSTLEEVLTGDPLAKLRRQAYGLESSPDDFLCKGCVFALTCQA